MTTLMVQSQRTITDCAGDTMGQRTVEELRAVYRMKELAVADRLANDISETVGSPIEEMLVWALIGNEDASFQSFTFPSRFLLGGDGETPCLFVVSVGSDPLSHVFALQPTIVAGGRRYRLDVALELSDDLAGRVYVAIECDGHEFHEKTREQAEADKRRDRDLQSIGWTIARFTGAEIFRDPHAAAKSATDLAWAQLTLRREAAINASTREKKGD